MKRFHAKSHLYSRNECTIEELYKFFLKPRDIVIGAETGLILTNCTTDIRRRGKNCKPPSLEETEHFKRLCKEADSEPRGGAYKAVIA